MDIVEFTTDMLSQCLCKLLLTLHILMQLARSMDTICYPYGHQMLALNRYHMPTISVCKSSVAV